MNACGEWVRVSQNREPSPSEVIMDSQSVETATMVSKEVGYDSGKKIKGRKRHILIDILGKNNNCCDHCRKRQ
ncbi:hypothetical protein [Nostoc sp.]|uniref:hypothetical protein n=1 Tax=Nostoc sp. TaxID=1180 RepID=UPI002FFB2DA7